MENDEYIDWKKDVNWKLAIITTVIMIVLFIILLWVGTLPDGGNTFAYNTF